MNKPTEQFKLRLPEKLRQAIEKSARNSRRSLTSEIVVRLEESVVQGDLYPLHSAPRVVRAGKGGHKAAEPGPVYTFPEFEQRLIEAFRRLPNDKKKALLTLLQSE